jgi:hypothetical protein
MDSRGDKPRGALPRCRGRLGRRLGGARLPNDRYAQSAPRNILKTLRCLGPENSPSRGSGLWQGIKATTRHRTAARQAFRCSRASKPDEHVTSVKIFRPFWSLALPVSDRSASQARQRSTGVHFIHVLLARRRSSPAASDSPGSQTIVLPSLVSEENR